MAPPRTLSRPAEQAVLDAVALRRRQRLTLEIADLMAALKKSLETMKPPASSKPTREREAAEEKKAPARGKQKGTSRKAG